MLDSNKSLIENCDFNNDFSELINRLWQMIKLMKPRAGPVNVISVALGKKLLPSLSEHLSESTLAECYLLSRKDR